MIIYGHVVRLEPAHGFGFIHDDSHGDWFFVDAGVRAGGMASLWVGERVGFTFEATPAGPRASDIHPEAAD
ncbi:MAG: cold shock domain-containing protein [Vicinamibacterales bacterium]